MRGTCGGSQLPRVAGTLRWFARLRLLEEVSERLRPMGGAFVF
jgi:hypothetical protein